MKTRLRPFRGLLSGIALLTTLVGLMGCSRSEESVKLITLESYINGVPRRYSDAVIIEKRSGYIKFRAYGEVFEYSGSYTIQR